MLERQDFEQLRLRDPELESELRKSSPRDVKQLIAEADREAAAESG